MKLLKKDLAEIKDKRNELTGTLTFVKYATEVVNKFKVGDILLKREITVDDDNQRIIRDLRYEDSHVTERAIVAHVDEDGLAWVKHLDKNGKPEPSIFCVLSDIDNSYYDDSIVIYDIDPLMIEHVLIGQDYNVQTIFKQEKDRQKSIANMRKNMSHHFSSLSDLNRFISQNLNKKNFVKIYYHKAKQEYYEGQEGFYAIDVDLKFSSVRNLANARSSTTGINSLLELDRIGLKYELDDNKVFYFRTLRNSGRNRTITSLDLLNRAIYLQEPKEIEML